MVRKIARRGKLAKKPGKTRHQGGGRPAAKTIETSLQATLLALLAKQTGAMTVAEIMAALHLIPPQLPLLQKNLLQLTDAHRIEKKGKRFALAAPPEALRATLDLTAKGFGFAVIEGEAKGGKDVFIAPHNLGGASHGDAILVTVTGTARGRREGRVIEVLNRAVTKFCGIFSASGAGGHVTPDDDRLPYTVLIRRGDEMGAGDGMAVVAEITDYGSERQGPTGKILELLGDSRTVKVQIRMAIIQSGLRETFPAAVLEAADQLTAVTECTDDRKDLRHLPHVTIDGETARDFDDAICVVQTENGFTLYVSIADVGHYITPNSPIDQEAYLRGTSVYLPDRVLPMLPERLSNNLCSLVPDQDRPAMTAILTFDQQGQRIDQRYCKSLIRSRQRFTYTTVNQLVYLNDPLVRAAHADLTPMLELAKELTALLKAQRRKRGSLEFNLPESLIAIEQDHIASITLAERNQAHLLIEDCMLAANEAVAETLAKARRPVLYRIHQYPDLTKLDTFTDAAKALGLHLPQSEVNPGWFALVIAQAKGSPTEYIVNNLLLRTMQQARYSPENAGHFGLAADFYLHFTSPIRRYPDLVAHRVLHAMLLGASAEIGRLPFPEEGKNLVEAGVYLSQCERKAIDIERNVHVRCAALFLIDRIGETFGAIISGVTAFGLFVVLDDCYISGSVPLTTMTDDYYLHDSRRYRLIGERSNRMYQLGDRVNVRLDNVDLLNKRLTFSISTDISSEPLPKNDGEPA
ncbi:MAG: ribonuclease R [Desulfobulbaceae bacterium]|nr:ribonuclease R [Desulfobulbaceae bacterium]